jgi:hypothetical protein
MDQNDLAIKIIDNDGHKQLVVWQKNRSIHMVVAFYALMRLGLCRAPHN